MKRRSVRFSPPNSSSSSLRGSALLQVSALLECALLARLVARVRVKSSLKLIEYSQYDVRPCACIYRITDCSAHSVYAARK